MNEPPLSLSAEGKMRRNKQWEPFSNIRVPVKPLFVRLDGVNFGSVVNQLGAQRPFDERVMRALVDAVSGLHLQGLAWRAAFIISDEITLGFSRSIPYGGRIEKVLSVTAGYCSSSVRASFYEIFHKDVPVSFDARILLVSQTGFWDYLSSRQKVNRNNCIISYCAMVLQEEQQKHGKRNILHKLGQPQMIQILLDSGIDINALPPWQTNGVVCYRDCQTNMLVEVWDVPPFDSEEGRNLFGVIYEALFLPDVK